MTKDFALFRFLPAEIRIQIWQNSIPLLPQTIGLRAFQVINPEFAIQDPRRVSFEAHAHPNNMPALLSVNRESREIAVLHYLTAYNMRTVAVVR